MRGPRQSWRKRQSADWTPPAKESKERRAGGGGKMTDFRTEDGGSLLRRPSDSGAMQEMKASYDEMQRQLRSIHADQVRQLVERCFMLLMSA